MDNNLSIITSKRVMEVLREKTNSEVPRLKRIENSNPILFEKLGNPKNVTKKLAEELIEWNDEISYQKTYILIFNNNMKDFKDSYFPLGLLLYDIPANQNSKLNFLSELNKAYEIIESKE